jgi:hypothetical protein
VRFYSKHAQIQVGSSWSKTRELQKIKKISHLKNQKWHLVCLQHQHPDTFLSDSERVYYHLLRRLDSTQVVSNDLSTERKAPAVVAASLLDKFGGDSPAAKAGTFTLTASIAAYLISKEIYIVDAEFFELLCLFGAYYVWYSGGKDAAASYFAGRQKVGIIDQANQDSFGKCTK